MEILEHSLLTTKNYNLKGGLIQADYNKSKQWNTGDSAQSFNANKDDPRMDPKYITGPQISYDMNSLGYRCDEISEYKDNEFIAVFGCSYTEGVGLHKEDLWHYHVGKELGLPVMNLGMGGTGIDYQTYNTILYCKNKLPKPKLVMYQYPGEYRKLFRYPHGVQSWVSLSNEGDVTNTPQEKYDYEWYTNRYLVYPEQAKMYNFFNYQTIKLLWNQQNVPNYHWAWLDDYAPNDRDFNTIYTPDGIEGDEWGYPARDLQHPGAAVHLDVYQQIIHGVKECLKK